ncbi:MAG: proton-translocating NADH-quinone oxidoreductase, chain [Fibrobacteres bacterium]|nr:proton-translocating NADH-quinone oxidoreductase, chain [Fibrobacterota bacterium]
MGDPAMTGASAWETLGRVGYGILALPFLSFLINGLWLGRKSPRASAWTATALMGLNLALAVILAMGYRAMVLGDPQGFPQRTALLWNHTWMDFTLEPGTALAARFGFYLDPISVMMVLVISFISFLVNVYSIGYMQGDKGAGRFFPLLSFFSFTMLGLVVSSNLVQTFFFWELVGAASYLLIGFWYTKPSAVAASKKAFVLTRFADAFFLMGMLVTGIVAGGFDFAHLNGPEAAAALNHTLTAGMFTCNLLTLGTLGIYMGAWGKSAMFPFHVWLPDAMEGPTPVSSLIHSATMVVAGVYLTARLFPLFSAAEHTLRVVEFTGAFTAVFAAAIACTQTDLKRILAFSTLSQLGLMMFALGTGGSAYPASMFHIFTHAFFKCLLFLSAGVVIHAIHSNDVRDAGGLRKSLPRTYWATLIAVLAIAGIFPFSGFFSKEEILHAALANGRYGAFLAGLATSALTAFYMSRYFFLVFHGPRRGSPAHHAHGDGHKPIREGLLMTLPILVLAVPSAFIGWLSKGFFLDHVKPPVPGFAEGASAAGESHGAGLGGTIGGGAEWLPIVATVLALTGVAVSWYWYGLKKNGPGFPGRAAPLWYRVLADKFYIDEAYLFLAKRVGGRLIAAPAAWVERNIVNGAFDLVTGAVRKLAFLQGLFHNGQVQVYIAVALVGLWLLARFGSVGY